MATPFSSGKPNSSDPSRSGADSAAEAPSSAANSSANASANDFESELMSDFPNRKTPAWRADGTALPSQSLPKGTVPTTDNVASTAADAKSRYNDSFTVDYNPDPDLQADNEDIQTHPLNRAQLNGQSKSQLSNKNGASGVVQERYQRQPAINPIKVAQAPISVVA
ncbi:MAG: hypothetical protein AAF810_27145, partial [Cyanobacteria bacterium P01_D01_bin.36]